MRLAPVPLLSLTKESAGVQVGEVHLILAPLLAFACAGIGGCESRRATAIGDGRNSTTRTAYGTGYSDHRFQLLRSTRRPQIIQFCEHMRRRLIEMAKRKALQT